VVEEREKVGLLAHSRDSEKRRSSIFGKGAQAIERGSRQQRERTDEPGLGVTHLSVLSSKGGWHPTKCGIKQPENRNISSTRTRQRTKNHGQGNAAHAGKRVDKTGYVTEKRRVQTPRNIAPKAADPQQSTLTPRAKWNTSRSTSIL